MFEKADDAHIMQNTRILTKDTKANKLTPSSTYLCDMYLKVLVYLRTYKLGKDVHEN